MIKIEHQLNEMKFLFHLTNELANSGRKSFLCVILTKIKSIFLFFFLRSFVALRFRSKGAICSDRYESHTITNDVKDDPHNRRNQQVYSASPVKIIDKDNESEMYEISPYATFSMNGGRTVVQSHAKTPTRNAHTPASLDYTMQFKTFGHPESDLNATAYPILPSGFGHVKGKSSWHKQRYYNTDGNKLQALIELCAPSAS